MNPIGRAIAIIDDDVAICDSASFLLETYDFVVLTYLSGADFLRDDPDIACLVVDYRMPGMNGLELVSDLRKRGSTVAVIMISATTDASFRRRAAELGVNYVLEKPFSNQALIDAICGELQ